MNGTVKEWIDKAESDYRVCAREVAVHDAPSYEAVCFHAQQCVEKFMKALLIQQERRFPPTHNLPQLVELLGPIRPGMAWPIEDLRFLTRIGAGFRYPGELAERGDAMQAMAICERLRRELLGMLGEEWE